MGRALRAGTRLLPAARLLVTLYWFQPDAPIALCLHGFPDTAHGWRKVAPRLVDAGWQDYPWLDGDGAWVEGRLTIDSPQQVVASYTYELPFGARHKLASSGIVFASTADPAPRALFYFQNFSSLTDYFDATKRSPTDTVGGRFDMIAAILALVLLRLERRQGVVGWHSPVTADRERWRGDAAE